VLLPSPAETQANSCWHDVSPTHRSYWAGVQPRRTLSWIQVFGWFSDQMMSAARRSPSPGRSAPWPRLLTTAS